MVDIVDVGFVDEHFDEVAHRVGDVFGGEDGRLVGDGVIIFQLLPEFFIELVPADGAEIILSGGEEHIGQIFFSPLDGDHLAGHQDAENRGQDIFLRRLIKPFAGVLRIFNLKTVEDDFTMKRPLPFQVYELNEIHTELKELVDFVGMQEISCSKHLPLFAVDHRIDILGKITVLQRRPHFGIVDQFDVLTLIECIDDLFAAVVADRPKQQGSENLLFSVDFCIDQRFLFIDFKFQPRSPIWDDAG
ncbi:MAG: hypothetical protein BWY50_01749 [Spirochaetes bacterium ADurb.Bin315]|nr:MAG: hypothetical protein BWY50_01749 [Spirochaetes bacterium ADurb.Bin315]